MSPDLFDWLSQAPLFLDQTRTLLEIDREEVERFYAPLAYAVLERARPDRREIVAVAGPPGSGKTAFATTLTAAVNALAGEEQAVLVGLDGWHFPNAYLDSHFVEYQGESIPLRRLKGTPQTYDLEGIAAFLAQVQRAERVSYPAYSRERHDPIPDGGTIQAGQRIVILEGNYWLLDQPPWSEFQGLFDLRIFLTAAPETLLDGLRERHRRGGKSPDFIERQLREVDLADMDLVLRLSRPADVTVYKADSRRISHIK